MKRGWIGLAAALLAVSCSNEDTIDPGTWNSYRNPVEQSDVQDPAVCEVDGTFYIFATGTSESILPIMESADLVNWDLAGTVFNELTVPTFISGAIPQSPDVAKVGDKYLMYYTMYSTAENSGIGVAAADVATGPYVDHGKLILSSEQSIAGVASPSFFTDGESNYLVFGNFDGIFIIELSADGLSLASGARPVKVASELFDAPQVYVREGKYYLFASVGSISGLQDSGCIQVIGRADDVYGPYLDRNSKSMSADGYQMLISGSTKFAGPGHGYVFDAPDGKTWVIYNAYDLSSVDSGRTLMLDCVNWSDGWPSVRGSIGSFCADAPALNK